VCVMGWLVVVCGLTYMLGCRFLPPFYSQSPPIRRGPPSPHPVHEVWQRFSPPRQHLLVRRPVGREVPGDNDHSTNTYVRGIHVGMRRVDDRTSSWSQVIAQECVTVHDRHDDHDDIDKDGDDGHDDGDATASFRPFLHLSRRAKSAGVLKSRA
jgi:hypothetical protein